MAPLFSVIIPTFNQAEFLRVALRSVLDQTYRDFEVIIVNNYSTDDTRSVIAHFYDSRVQVIDYRNNGVIGAGRNVGINASVGRYVAFLDSDDTWYPEKLERIAQVIEEDPEAGLISHNQEMIRDGDLEAYSSYGPPEGFDGDMYEFLLIICNPPSTSSSVVAKKYLDQVGGFSEDPEFITVEDYDLWLELAKVCRFLFLPDVLGAHHYHSASASANVETHLNSGVAVLDKHSRTIKKSDRNYPRFAIRKLYSSAYYVAARQYHRRGAFLKTLGYYTHSLRIYPFRWRAYGGLVLLFADLILGQRRRKKIVNAVLGPAWRWG
jgi:glycosyltransferase involved in cell wall biosynthesis